MDLEIKTAGAPNLEDVHFDGGDDRHHRRKKSKNLNLKCPICESGTSEVTYKDVYLLKKFTSVRGKIISPEKSGVCAKHQRQLTRSIKRARYVSLLPFVAMD
jgi:small subunit ribosomal protein S18